VQTIIPSSRGSVKNEKLNLLQICEVQGCKNLKSNPDTQPSAPHHTDNFKTKAPNTTGSNHLYNTLELLIMGIIVPETC
jgi:hypothetical protein